MRIRRQRDQEQRRGAVALEFSLTLPIMLAVVFGIIEFGRAMAVGQLVTSAAREGTRLATLSGSSNADVDQAVKQFLVSSLKVSEDVIGVKISVTAAPGNPDPHNDVGSARSLDLCTVEVSVPFNETSYGKLKYLNDASFTGRMTMRHE